MASLLDSISSGIAGVAASISSLVNGSSLVSNTVSVDTRDSNRARPRIASTDPTTAIDTASNTTILSFPADRPKYYMSFGFEEYTRPSMFEGLSSNGITDYICLPMPGNLHDSSNFNYAIEDGSFEVDANLPALRQYSNSWASGSVDSLSSFASSTGQLLSSFGSSQSGSALRSLKSALASGSGGDSLMQIAGLADNPFQTVAFKGAYFKQHSFSWRLSPKTSAEAATMQTIINTFKKVAHPELLSTTLGGFYKYPDIVWPKFNPDAVRANLYTFKPCVITSFDVNWAPNDRPGFFTDSNPIEVVMSINLQEIELWRGSDGSASEIDATSGDFNNVPSPPVANLGLI